MSSKAEEIQLKTKKSLKWSTLGEIIGRLITPITTAILSRILAPEIFGIVTTITIVISFCEIFADGGFAKYIIQSDFKDDEKNKSLTVAFWSNFVLSALLFIIICIFNKQIAKLVGSKGYELPLIIACIQVPIYSISGTLTSIFRREFKFNKLFYIRIITALVNLCCSVPLALLGFTYWSIIIGNITSLIVSTIVMLVMSDWKPTFYFSFNLFRKMFSFSFLNLIEAIIIWLSSWITSLIISNKMDPYYLGIYKNSVSMVQALFGIITSAITPVLFSSLSRMKDDENEFNKLYYKMQSMATFILLPIGIGLFIYRDVATYILFGEQWSEASLVIGAACFTRVLLVIFSYFASEVYRSRKKPIISIISQLILLIITIPVCLYTVKQGFTTYVIAASSCNLILVITSLIFQKCIFKMPLGPMIKNLLKPLISCIIMAIIAKLLLLVSKNYLYQCFTILICIVVYFLSYYLLFKNDFYDKTSFLLNKTNR